MIVVRYFPLLVICIDLFMWIHQEIHCQGVRPATRAIFLHIPGPRGLNVLIY
jgi:hypothetical protein